jgi:hypothetical protein
MMADLARKMLDFAVVLLFEKIVLFCGGSPLCKCLNCHRKIFPRHDGYVFSDVFVLVHLFHPGEARQARLPEGTVRHTYPLIGLCDRPGPGL